MIVPLASRPLLAALLLTASLLPAASRAAPADVRALLEGVTEIVAPGATPGPVVAFGPDAFAVVTALQGKHRLPLVAATRFGRGRAVAIGHEGFLGQAALARPDNARLLANAARWSGSGRTGIHIVTVEKDEAAQALAAAGFRVERLSAQTLYQRMEAPDFDVVVFGAGICDGPAGLRIAQSLTAFCKRGGGLVADSLGWGWLQLHPGRTLARDHGGNRLLVPMGLAWADGFFSSTGKEGGWLADGLGLDGVDGLAALRTLWGYADRLTSPPAALIGQAAQTVAAITASLPADERFFLPRVRALCRKHRAGDPWKKGEPISLENPLARLQAVLDWQTIRARSAIRQKPYPSAGVFPGYPAPGFHRVVRTVLADLSTPGWQGTGLYASPGDILTVNLPPAATGKGLHLRIGCHTDTLWHLDTWKRFPEITLRTRLAKTIVHANNPFGGPVYIEVPDGLERDRVEITIAGAVEAPRFIRGETLLTDWREEIRRRPAPWAELEGKRVVLTVPSAVARDLDDPEALLAYWDEMLDLCADLYALPRERRRPERFCVDVQISAGYMHAGYPIMTHDDVARTFTDLSILRGSDSAKVWGFYHEMGHNHQRDAWTFEGAGEVTNNLAALYCAERLNGVSQGAHPALAPEKIQERKAKYLAAGAKFDEWKADPFLALTLYIEIKDAFGWEALTRTFATYHAETPWSDDEKRDQWLLRLSRTVGKNLGPFFTAWGVPTSDAARNALTDLPVWMP